MLFTASSKPSAISVLSLWHSFAYTKWVVFRSISMAGEQARSEKPALNVGCQARQFLLIAGNTVKAQDKNNSKANLCLVCFLPVVKQLQAMLTPAAKTAFPFWVWKEKAFSTKNVSVMLWICPVCKVSFVDILVFLIYLAFNCSRLISMAWVAQVFANENAVAMSTRSERCHHHSSNNLFILRILGANHYLFWKSAWNDFLGGVLFPFL